MHRSLQLTARPLIRLAALSVVLGACQPNSLVDVQVPTSILDPAIANSATGAQALYGGALLQFVTAFGGSTDASNGYVGATGMFTDEFQPGTSQSSSNSAGLDSRAMMNQSRSNPLNSLYGALHKARIQAGQARLALLAYAPETPKALSGQLFALEGYTELFFAELYCSGTPLSQIQPDGDLAFGAGLKTEDIYERAIAHFDSAAQLGTDSARILNLARVGKGRALLNEGKWSAAAAAVRDVPTTFAYDVEYSSTSITLQNPFAYDNMVVTVADHEGGNGLAWAAASDPRVVLQTVSSSFEMVNAFKKYLSPTAPIRLASGIEARLIEAEADLQSGGAHWLAILDTLRTDGTQSGGTYNPGTGNVANLAPLADPGSADARVDLVMRERAFWLFATGHRQGDLRRLLKLYGRVQGVVYPTGAYLGAPYFHSDVVYGTDVVAAPDPAERSNNYRYTGCFNTNP